MTKTDFIWLCNECSVHPSIALEDSAVRHILKTMSGVAQQIALSTHLKENL